jgi:hypothetical protein
LGDEVKRKNKRGRACVGRVEMHTGYFWGTLNDKRPLEDKHMEENNIKMSMKEIH